MNEVQDNIPHKVLVPDEVIASKIYLIRGKKVMLDRDLAKLYGVTTGNFNKAVKRNFKRFPNDFMFQLTREEMKNWIFQFGISNKEKMGLRKPPYAFTEQGVAMLSGILYSDRAIAVNIQIMRMFTKMREMLLTNKDLLLKMEQMEKEVSVNKKDIKTIFDTFKKFIEPKQKPRTIIGFQIPQKKK